MSLREFLLLKIYLYIQCGRSTMFPMFQFYCCSAECLLQSEVAICALVCVLITASTMLTSRLEGISGGRSSSALGACGICFLKDGIQLQKITGCTDAIWFSPSTV